MSLSFVSYFRFQKVEKNCCIVQYLVKKSSPHIEVIPTIPAEQVDLDKKKQVKVRLRNLDEKKVSVRLYVKPMRENIGFALLHNQLEVLEVGEEREVPISYQLLGSTIHPKDGVVDLAITFTIL